MTREAPQEASLSRANPLVARVRLLSRSPEERARAGLMVAEGIRLAGEALREGVAIEEAIVSPRLDRDPRAPALMSDLAAAGVRVRRAADALLASLHDAETHQGILLVVRRAGAALAALAPAGRRPLVLVACGVQDPGNMGSLVRLADAAGATGLLAAGGADPFGPKAARASAGSIFRLPVARAAGIDAALALSASLRQGGARIAGAVTRGGVSYREADLTGPLALFLGSEAAGLPAEAERAIDLPLTIPIHPRVESLNVAAAAAILLFAAASPEGLTTLRGPDRSGPGPAEPDRADDGRAPAAARARRGPRRAAPAGPSRGRRPGRKRG